MLELPWLMSTDDELEDEIKLMMENKEKYDTKQKLEESKNEMSDYLENK